MKLFSLQFLFLSILIIISNPKEETTQSPETPETTQSPDTPQSSSDTITNQINNTIPKGPSPEAKIILPIRRKGTSLSAINTTPCGGVKKLLSNTLTNEGSIIHFVWETVIPSAGGNCTVRISPGTEKEEDFKLLYPYDGKMNKDGSFSCGEIKGFESKGFKLPDDYECDGCILQWKWSTNFGDIYSCSDVMINGDKLVQCMAKCQNGGTCFNGKCICLKEFSGEFCEGKKKEINWLLIELIVLAILLIGVITFFGIIYLLKKFFPKWTKNKKSTKETIFFERNKENDFGDIIIEN